MSLAVSIAFLVAASILLVEFIWLYFKVHTVLSNLPVPLPLPPPRQLTMPAAPSPAASKSKKEWLEETIKSMEDTAPAADIVKNFSTWSYTFNSETLVLVQGCLANPAELAKLRTLSYKAGDWLEPGEPDQEMRRRLARQAAQYFLIRDSEDKVVGFRYLPSFGDASSEGDFSLQAMDAAIRVISRASDVVQDWEQVVDASATFLLEQFYHGESGLFRLQPEDSEYSVFATFAALSTIWNIWPWLSPERKGLLRPVVAGVSRTLVTWESDLWEIKGNIFGYRITKTDEERPPCISTTENVYRISVFQRGILGRNTELFDHLRNNRKGMLRLVQESQANDGQGFARCPGERVTPIHSRYSLQLLRAMAKDGLLTSQDLSWINGHKLLQFLLRCRSDQGFGNEPGLMPSVAAARACVNVAKLLEIFRLNGVFPDSNEYHFYLNELTHLANKLPEFIDECSDSEESGEEPGAYWSFPYKYIQAAQVKT